MLDPSSNFFASNPAKVAVHIDDIPQTPAEQTVAEEDKDYYNSYSM